MLERVFVIRESLEVQDCNNVILISGESAIFLD
jgi:hypothetical protein